MKGLQDFRTVERLRGIQGGVFTLADLRRALSDPHRAALHRRIDRLIRSGLLERFTRGIYVTGGFDPGVLSQRIAPDSAVSFETVLVREGVIAPRSAREVSALRGGRPERYEACGFRVEHHRIDPRLRLGESVRDGVRSTDAEKALLDVLAFHLRGRRAHFDLRDDVALDRLDPRKLSQYLGHYRNPRFVAFARGLLRLP